MGLVFSETASGLVTAHKAADEAAVSRALKQHDRDLCLVPKMIGGRLGWCVMKHLGSAIDAQWICDWEHGGEALPLSHGLVARVKDLDLNSRAPRPDPEADNAALVAAARAETDEASDELAKDVVDRIRGRTAHLLPRGAYRRNTRFKDIRR